MKETVDEDAFLSNQCKQLGVSGLFQGTRGAAISSVIVSSYQ